MTTNRTQTVKRLPAPPVPPPVPGQTVTIPLELLPLYYQAHRLEAMDRGEVAKIEQAKGQSKPDGVVLVKRIG